MSVTYSKYTPADHDQVIRMMIDLYQDDPGGLPMTREKAAVTLDTLVNQPSLGTVMVIRADRQIAGYALLINFWSNEFGGIILTIDELYLKPAFRGQGIATAFITYLRDSSFGEAVCLQLEVTPGNTEALRLYERLGFTRHKNNTYDLLL